MFSQKRWLSQFLIGILIISQTLFLIPQKTMAAENRLAGPDRYRTAVAISQSGWQSSNYAVLVRGDDFADALCAGPLAQKYNAPILFTGKYNLNEYTNKELQRLGSNHVFVIGGYGAISQQVDRDVYALGIYNVERIFGNNRYETSVEIAKRLGSKEIVLATGDQYADALSASVIAAIKGYSILLTSGDSLPTSVKKHITNYKIIRTYIIGGNSAISKDIEKQVPAPTRIAGNDRYDTNIKIIEKFSKDLDFNKVYLATGEGKTGYADSLAGVVLAAKTASPIVLSGKTFPKITRESILDKLAVATKVITLGGEKAVSKQVVNDFNQCINSVSKSVFRQSGFYGPSTGTTTITGNLELQATGITVQNTIVEGDLLIGEGIGSGAVELKNVTIKGRTTIQSGGDSSILCEDFNSQTAIIDAPNSQMTFLSLKGKSKVSNVQIESNVILDDSGSNSEGFTDINIIKAGEVQLVGKFTNVNLYANGALVRLEGATVTNLNAKARGTINGFGINTANILSNGIQLQFYPTIANVNKGLEVIIGSEVFKEGTVKGAGIGSNPQGINNLSGIPGNSQVQLTFVAPTGGTNVVLKQSIDGGATWVNSSTYFGLDQNSTTATAIGLTNGVSYKFKLVVSGGPKAGDSNIITVVPHNPIIDFIGVTKDGQATFYFSPPTNATSVTVKQSTDGGTTWSDSNTGTLNDNSTQATAIGLSNGQSYQFKLVVVGGSRAGQSNIVSVTPVKPINDLVGTPGNGQISFSFSAPSIASSVVLQQSNDNGFNWIDSVTGQLNANSNSAVVTGLISGHTYRFKVVVVGGPRAGESNVVIVTPN